MPKAKKNRGAVALTAHVEDSLFYQVAQLNRVFREAADSTLSQCCLSQRSYWLLECLGRDRGCSQVELGDVLGLDRADLTRLIDVLESEGLLSRVRSTQDRRKQVITITAKGVALRSSIRRKLARAEEELLAGLSEKQSARLRKYASRLTSELG